MVNESLATDEEQELLANRTLLEISAEEDAIEGKPKPVAECLVKYVFPGTDFL